MITLLHVFPLESEHCRAKGADHPVHSVVRKNNDICVFQCQNCAVTRSLLFQCAVSYATKESTVIYICRQQVPSLPLGVHGMPSSDSRVLNYISFLYLDTVEDVMDFCASVHNREDKVGRPNLIIVDDIGSYIEQLQGPCQDHKVAKLCALLCDAVHCLNNKQGGSCSLLLSCLRPSQRFTSVYWKMGMQVMDIQENPPGEFALSTVQDDSTLEVEFNLRRGVLFLKRFRVTVKGKKGV
uniref:Uncharacterized protein LOC111103091 isoform X1 n=2 Tax=Crassostrea virginica TaxID=6565 RepID=A0A8B8ANV9_CRAVI|nr:uncharacterized protein LOC111103091 isoform X1 [Crassostrea virginica]